MGYKCSINDVVVKSSTGKGKNLTQIEVLENVRTQNSLIRVIESLGIR